MFYRSSPRQLRRRFLDGFVLTSVSGLVLLFVMPEVIAQLGMAAFLFVFGGLVAPLLLEKFSGLAERTTHIAALGLALAGLLMHTMLDGVALSQGSHEQYSALAVAVIVHRLPVSVVAWKLVADRYNRWAAWAVLVLIGVMTTIGFFGGGSLPETGTALAAFQAFVAGSLLHVIGHTHDHGNDSCCGPARPRKWAEGIGALFGIALLLAVPILLGHSHGEPDAIAHFGERLLYLALESAPALILGYILAGLIGAMLPARTVGWIARGNTLTQALKGAAVGIPLPICSCGVVPVYEGLVKRGVPAAAAMAFLIATPEIGIESMLLSVPLLGLKVTGVRLLGAAFVALLAGVVVGGRVRSQSLTDDNATVTRAKDDKWGAARDFTQDVIDDTAGWILVGLMVAAFFEPGSLTDVLASLSPTLEILAFASLGIPVYVCASGATPLAAALVLAGATPGAAIAFLLAGPATNVTTFGLLARLHGRGVALAFGVTVFVAAVVVGISADSILDAGALPLFAGEESHPLWAGVQWLSLTLFGLMVFDSVLRLGPTEFLASVTSLGGHADDHCHDDGHDDDHCHDDDHRHDDEVHDSHDGCCGDDHCHDGEDHELGI